MTATQSPDFLQQAQSLHQDGRLEAAEPLYRSHLAQAPEDAMAHHGLGALAVEQKRFDTGLEHLRQALELAPEEGLYWQSFAEGLLLAERVEEALTVIEQALANGLDTPLAHALHERIVATLMAGKPAGQEQDGASTQLITLFNDGHYAETERLARAWIEDEPDEPFGWKMLGAALTRQGSVLEAIPVLEKALSIQPQDVESLNTLGVCLQQLGRLEEAGVQFAQAARIAPGFTTALHNLALLLQQLGRHEEAVAYCERILELNPEDARVLNDLANSLRELGRIGPALSAYRQALTLQPGFAHVYSNLGNLLLALGNLEEARSCHEQALKLQPGQALILGNLANVHQHLGQLDRAEELYREASRLQPRDATIFSRLLFTANYHPEHSAEEIFALYQEYERRFAVPLYAEWRPHANDRTPQRRLRVGYVSPDFREHSLARGLEPLLAGHDHAAFEITLYADLSREDAMSARYRALADHWVLTTGMTDADLAARIRADGIDLLIDLAGHTQGNRLGVFARKPAPVSVSWMGYGYTTGLRAIDYFLCDEWLVPPGSESLFTEQPWRLPAPAGFYRPRPDMGEEGPLPARSRGHLTLGSLSRGIRLNDRVLHAWAEILRRLPDAQLVIDSQDFAGESSQRTLAERFAAEGIAPERLQIGYHSPPWDVLRGVDIALDSFPHNNGTTLLECLLMGVPFVTLAARPSVGRIGTMVLESLGHPEWIARDESDYVERTLALAADPDALVELRGQLRQQVLESPWCDEGTFVARVEQAYRDMWQQWCARTRH